MGEARFQIELFARGLTAFVVFSSLLSDLVPAVFVFEVAGAGAYDPRLLAYMPDLGMVPGLQREQ